MTCGVFYSRVTSPSTSMTSTSIVATQLHQAANHVTLVNDVSFAHCFLPKVNQFQRITTSPLVYSAPRGGNGYSFVIVQPKLKIKPVCLVSARSQLRALKKTYIKLSPAKKIAFKKIQQLYHRLTALKGAKPSAVLKHKIKVMEGEWKRASLKNPKLAHMVLKQHKLFLEIKRKKAIRKGVVTKTTSVAKKGDISNKSKNAVKNTRVVKVKKDADDSDKGVKKMSTKTTRVVKVKKDENDSEKGVKKMQTKTTRVVKKDVEKGVKKTVATRVVVKKSEDVEEKKDDSKNAKKAPQNTVVNVKEDEDEGDDEDEEEEDAEKWTKYVHPELHHHVRHFVKHSRQAKPKHKAVQFFKDKVKEWWHDEEEDDEHDLKRMKHIFSVIQKHVD